MDETFKQSIKLLIDKLKEEIVIDIINANIAHIENLRPKVDKIAIFIHKLKEILKNENENLLFSYANEINIKIQERNREANNDFECADYQYILINILNLFPHQYTSNYPNYFDKELSNKVFERLNTFKNTGEK